MHLYREWPAFLLTRCGVKGREGGETEREREREGGGRVPYYTTAYRVQSCIGWWHKGLNENSAAPVLCELDTVRMTISLAIDYTLFRNAPRAAHKSQ